MSYQRDLKYYNSLTELTWGSGNFLSNPGPDAGNAWDAKEFRDIVLTLVGTGVIKLYGSAQKNPPDFNKASTINNSWTPIALVDYSLVGSPAYFAGATGITVTSATKLAEADTNLLTWFAIHRSTETVDVLVTIATTL